MPELPEVEILRCRFAKAALNRRIDAVGVQRPGIIAGMSPREFSARLIGRRFRQARRHGKRLYASLDQGGWMSMHFGLTGDLAFYRDGESPPPFARVVFDFSGGRRLAYTNRRMIGRLQCVEDMDADVRARQLGPDALDGRLTVTAFQRALARRRGGVKSVLMDQSVVAGIGNVYADEILFQARVHPQTPLARLDERARAQLYRTMRSVLSRATLYRDVRISRERRTRGTIAAGAAGAERERLPKNFLIPHRRAGEKCPRCGRAIRRIAVEGRSSYFCPRCQSKTSRKGTSKWR